MAGTGSIGHAAPERSDVAGNLLRPPEPGGELTKVKPELAAYPEIRPGDAERAAVARRAEALAEVLRGLWAAHPDPVERLRMARHLALVTPGLGLRPEHISLQDVTDRGLAGHIADVTALRGAFEPASQPRYVGPLNDINPSEGGVRYIGPVN